ncbi:hypothetical protein GCM10023169_27010 [Georgenia halophila]|uniref:Uncharacterized protein n=1 Tax=Georgenia halophila TaxID=620889 RepID=A0ABP8LE21_9MICO
MSTILQKAVTPQMSAAYLGRGLDRVAGYVVPAADAAEVTTTAGLFELHGLDFDGTPFSPEGPIDILHLPTSPTAVVVPATGGVDEESRKATGGTFIERPPFTGTGFTTAEDAVVPLSWVEHTRLPSGSRLWRFTSDGEEPQLIGSYHGVAFGWQNHLEDDAFRAVPPSKLVGHVAKTEAGTYAADVTTDEDGRPTVITLVTHVEPEGKDFTRTDAGVWAKRIPADDAVEIFEMHATAKWRGVPVRIVDQGPNAEGEQVAHITSLLHDALAAERLGMDKLDVGVYEKTVALPELSETTYAQRVPRSWARPSQLEKARDHAAKADGGTSVVPPVTSGGAPTVGTPKLDVPEGADASANPMTRHAPQLQRVAQGLVNAAPAGWTRARVLARMIGKRGEIVAAYTDEEGNQKALTGLPADVGRAMAEIRQASYEEGKGTWLAALVTLERGGKLTLNIDRSSEQKWTKPPEPGDYTEDLKRYPREAENIPDWMREKLDEAEE